MSNFYVSSVAYAAIAPWAATTAYTIGQIIRPTAAPMTKRLAYHCTTAGTSGGTEPTWGLTNNATTASGTAVFTVINGDAYGWTGAAGDTGSVTNYISVGFAAQGDTIFLSSDHSETQTASFFGSITGTWAAATTYLISVSRAGSVPPAAADIATGAVLAASNALNMNPPGPIFCQGVTFQSAIGNINFAYAAYQTIYFKNCLLQITVGTSTYRISSMNPAKVIFDNTQLSFASASQGVMTSYQLDILWINTASPLAGTAVATLFQAGARITGTLRGVDLSGFNGALVTTGSTSGMQILLDSCKISASMTPFAGTANGSMDLIELVNCHDGTNVRNERYTAAGKVTTERTITLTGGAADDIGGFSLKMSANASKLDKMVAPLESFWFDVENTVTGVSKTATVEIVSSASLYNDEIWLQLEYMGASGNTLASFGNSLPATPLTAHAAATSSSAAWNSSPATPVYQHLQVTFTPQRAGRVRGRVMLGKASATVYVDPNIVIT
jgi:hypothetical protein